MAQFELPVQSKAAAMQLLHLQAALDTATAVKDSAGAGTQGLQQVLREVRDAVRSLGKGQKEISESLAQIARSSGGIEIAARTLGVPERDNVVAFFAAAVDTSGNFVKRTKPGLWLIEADYLSIGQIAAGTRTVRARKRQPFIEDLRRVRESKPDFQSGLCAKLDDSELGRFFDLAPSVFDAIKDSHSPEKDPDTNA